MRLVEQHVIDRDDPRFASIDQRAFAAKNLYNYALFILRQAFIRDGHYIPYCQMAGDLKFEEVYQSLDSANASQQVLRQLDHEWMSFMRARKEYARHPERFTGRPRLPKYKDKQKGRSLLVYTERAFSKVALREGLIRLAGLAIRVRTKQRSVRQVRIVPRKDHYVVEVVYEREPVKRDLNPDWVAGIDIGVNNLAALASNKRGLVPLVVNGRPLKSINQQFNKLVADLQAKLPNGQYSSRRIQAITTKRNRRVQDYLHHVSRQIVELLVRERVGRLIVGKNPEWKQGAALGRVNNQHFQQLPFARLVEMLHYKAELQSIQFELVEESYTSKCSCLDLEEIGPHEEYQGKRVKRGLFRAGDGRVINADVNGAANILRKAVPNGFLPDGIAGLRGAPGRVNPLRRSRLKGTQHSRGADDHETAKAA